MLCTAQQLSSVYSYKFIFNFVGFIRFKVSNCWLKKTSVKLIDVSILVCCFIVNFFVFRYVSGTFYIAFYVATLIRNRISPSNQKVFHCANFFVQESVETFYKLATDIKCASWNVFHSTFILVTNFLSRQQQPGMCVPLLDPKTKLCNRYGEAKMVLAVVATNTPLSFGGNQTLVIGKFKFEYFLINCSLINCFFFIFLLLF